MSGCKDKGILKHKEFVTIVNLTPFWSVVYTVLPSKDDTLFSCL